jgi:hypothetical protein
MGYPSRLGRSRQLITILDTERFSKVFKVRPPTLFYTLPLPNSRTGACQRLAHFQKTKVVEMVKSMFYSLD